MRLHTLFRRSLTIIPDSTVDDVDSTITSYLDSVLVQDAGWVKFSKSKLDPADFHAMLTKYAFVDRYINKYDAGIVSEDWLGAPRHTITKVSFRHLSPQTLLSVIIVTVSYFGSYGCR